MTNFSRFRTISLVGFLAASIGFTNVCAQKTENKNKLCPKWVLDAVFYEIYPQTFMDTDGDGIGDLRGISQKLPYVKSLGATAVWLNPFYESPFRDAGYDVSDFYKVAPRYGTMADAEKMIKDAHDLGLKIIIDYVPGHTSIDHPWFQESAKQTPNKYSNWYVWTDNTWADAGKEFAGKMIQGYSKRDGNYMNNFFWHQPALNFGFGKVDPSKPWQLPANHPDVLALKAEMKNVLKFWLEKGVDGFRIDMAGSLTKNDEGSAECIKWWKEVRAMLNESYPEAFIVSEWSHPPAALEGGFHADYLHWIPQYEDLFRKESTRSLNGVSLDGKSFFDREGKGNIAAFMKVYLEQYNETKKKGFISIPVGNHDLSRITNNRTKEDLEIIYAFLMTMPGVPFFYYGDEVGMKQLPIVDGKEGCYGSRAGARTPMQWTAASNAGFSTASVDKLWMPVDAASDKPNVDAAMKNPNSIWHTTKKLIEIRKTEKALMADAGFEILYAEENKYPFVYARTAGDETIIVALNPSKNKVAVNIPYTLKGKSILLNGKNSTLSLNGKNLVMNMEGVSYSIYKIKK